MVGDGIHDLAMKSHGAGLAIGTLTGSAGRAELAPSADLVLASIADLPASLSACEPVRAKRNPGADAPG